MLNIIEKIFATNLSVDDIFEATQIDPEKTPNIFVVSDKAIEWIFYFGSVLIFIYLLISGITFITAGGDAEKAKKGQQGIIYGVIGVVVMVLSLALVRIVSYMASNRAPFN